MKEMKIRENADDKGSSCKKFDVGFLSPFYFFFFLTAELPRNAGFDNIGFFAGNSAISCGGKWY